MRPEAHWTVEAYMREESGVVVWDSKEEIGNLQEAENEQNTGAKQIFTRQPRNNGMGWGDLVYSP